MSTFFIDCRSNLTTAKDMHTNGSDSEYMSNISQRNQCNNKNIYIDTDVAKQSDANEQSKQ